MCFTGVVLSAFNLSLRTDSFQEEGGKQAQSCAGGLHPQSDLSESRSKTVRETLNPTTRTESDTEKQLVLAAAASY